MIGDRGRAAEERVAVPEPAGGLVYALDFPDLNTARAAVSLVGDAVDMVKVGLELFVLAGPEALRLSEEARRPVFLDLKLHDIPETVDRAVARACALGVKMLTVHASGGAAMLERAASRAEREGAGLTLAAVTVLTSLDASDLARAGVLDSVEGQVLRLARAAWESGIRAFVCSPREVGTLRQALGPWATLVTPGIRPSRQGEPSDDQKRVATATEAIVDGANWLVVGRPIRDAPDPKVVAQSLREEIARAMSLREASPR